MTWNGLISLGIFLQCFNLTHLVNDVSLWRCWVLSSCMETDTVTVYYCDYGNNETVPRADFRSTYPEIWKLPPLAVPCKLHGKFFVTSRCVFMLVWYLLNEESKVMLGPLFRFWDYLQKLKYYNESPNKFNYSLL